jgi:hypothetical protein
MKYTFQSYIDNNIYEKRVWYWPCKWYVKPWALEMNEWEKEDAFFKKTYPVQYFFRETIDGFIFQQKSKFQEFKYDIKGRLCNPRKEMRGKVFPHNWNDLTESIVIFHLEAIIEFVDREKCFENINYDSDDDHKEFAKGLKECYDYAKSTRDSLKLKLSEAYERAPLDGEYDVIYKEVNDIEAEIEEYDTKVCEWVVKNRNYFWV